MRHDSFIWDMTRSQRHDSFIETWLIHRDTHSYETYRIQARRTLTCQHRRQVLWYETWLIHLSLTHSNEAHAHLPTPASNPMTVCTDFATPPKSIKSRNSAFPTSHGANPSWDVGWIWICTPEEFVPRKCVCVCVCLCVIKQVCICVCVCVCIYIYMRIGRGRDHICRPPDCVCVCVCACVCVYIHTYAHWGGGGPYLSTPWLPPLSALAPREPPICGRG